jgi:hypothetical protein
LKAARRQVSKDWRPPVEEQSGKEYSTSLTFVDIGEGESGRRRRKLTGVLVVSLSLAR